MNQEKPIMKLRFVLLFLVVCIPRLAAGQAAMPPETRNAALRYWLAFAELQDPPADQGTQELLEKTAAGLLPWDESRLGPILDSNEVAILAMHRATKLPECDWGLEYDRGPRASIAYAPRARVLARLNTLYGMRLAAKGDSQQAVEAWLDGLQFSQHMAKGGTLIFCLIAKMSLISNLTALQHAASQGQLNADQEMQAAAAVKAMPESGFDWGSALSYEEQTIEIALNQLKTDRDPADYFEKVIGHIAPPDFTLPTLSELARLRSLMGKAESALREPPEQAGAKLKALQEQEKSLHIFFREMAPGFTNINKSRLEIAAASKTLLSVLPAK
jgi:hypothetical protein